MCAIRYYTRVREYDQTSSVYLLRRNKATCFCCSDLVCIPYVFSRGTFLYSNIIMLCNLPATFKNITRQFTWADLVRFTERWIESHFYSSYSLTAIVLLVINTWYQCFIFIQTEEPVWMHCVNINPIYTVIHSFCYTIL